MNQSSQAVSSEPSSWSILVDGSALFFGVRAVSPEKSLDYEVLNDFLRRQSGSSASPRPAYFFTAADDANEKQAKFHEHISELNWNVRQVPPHEALIANPLLSEQTAKIIRFDAMIAYALGRLSSNPQSSSSHVFVVTDSWPLAGPIRDCVARGTPVTVCFFGSFIDNRWHKLFRESESRKEGPEFFDLDLHVNKLFARARVLGTKGQQVLTDLP